MWKKQRNKKRRFWRELLWWEKNTQGNFSNYENLDNVRCVKVNSSQAVRAHLTTKAYVDESTDVLSILKLDPRQKLQMNEKDFKSFNYNLTTHKTFVNKPINEVVNDTNAQEIRIDSDSSMRKNENLSLNEIEIANLKRVSVKVHPRSDMELTTKTYVDLKKNI